MFSIFDFLKNDIEIKLFIPLFLQRKAKFRYSFVDYTIFEPSDSKIANFGVYANMTTVGVWFWLFCVNFSQGVFQYEKYKYFSPFPNTAPLFLFLFGNVFAKFSDNRTHWTWKNDAIRHRISLGVISYFLILFTFDNFAFLVFWYCKTPWHPGCRWTTSDFR